MSEYLVLIYGDEQAWWADPGSSEKLIQAGREFVAANRSRVRGANRLRLSSTATSIRRTADGDLLVTDGTFVESKEVLGGYYLIAASDLDEAIKLASQVAAVVGGVEVRPVWPIGEP
jgi:hypothetical protein